MLERLVPLSKELNFGITFPKSPGLLVIPVADGRLVWSTMPPVLAPNGLRSFVSKFLPSLLVYCIC